MATSSASMVVAFTSMEVASAYMVVMISHSFETCSVVTLKITELAVVPSYLIYRVNGCKFHPVYRYHYTF